MFGKIFKDIFNSSIASDTQVRHVFMDLIVLADATGVVDMTYDAIARVTNMNVEDIVTCIDALMKPDPASRSGTANGARLALIDPGQRSWGWKITNFAHYRAIRDEEGRRAHTRGQRRRCGRGYIYYAVSHDRVVIKLSKNPWARIEQLKKTYPQINLAAKECGDQNLLRQRHQEFAKQQIEPEWFRLTVNLQHHIATVAASSSNGSLGSHRGSTGSHLGSNYHLTKGSPGSRSGSTSSQKKRTTIEAEGEAEEGILPSAVSLERETKPATPNSTTHVTNVEEAKRLICERILNGKDPSRPWSNEAMSSLAGLLPLPRLELERVAWFRNLPDDGSPELKARRTVTETGLTAFWGDEVTRAEAFWQQRYGWREGKGAAAG